MVDMKGDTEHKRFCTCMLAQQREQVHTHGLFFRQWFKPGCIGKVVTVLTALFHDCL